MKFFNIKKSPYIENYYRLSDVMAAIQIMGQYRFSARKADDWERLLGGKPLSSESWSDIFNEHPEFFRYDRGERGLHTLILRRANSKIFDTEKEILLDKEYVKSLQESDKRKISREPLSREQTLSLMKAAREMHDQAIKNHREKSWWRIFLLSLLAAILTNITAVIFKGYFPSL